LCLLCFGWDLTPYSSHKIHNKFFIHHCPGWKKGSFVCETVWFYFWVNTHPFDLKSCAFCPKFSEDFYAEFQEKTISGEFLRNFVQTKAILQQYLWNFALLYDFFILVRIALKKFTKVFSYVVCTQVRTHVHKQITERRYGEEKLGRFFSENQFCSLPVWDLPRLTPCLFWSEIFTRHSSLCLLSFGWDLSPRLVPQDS